MHFENSSLSLLLLLIPVLGIVLWGVQKYKQRRLSLAIEPALHSGVLYTLSPRKKRLKHILWFLALFFLILALMRPQYGLRIDETPQKSRSILVALDTSQSMLAQDISPTRLDHAKKEIFSLTHALDGDRIGLMAFAGNAHVLCPFSNDYGAFELFLNDCSVGSVSTPGTHLGTAIQAARQAFSTQRVSQKVLVILTDGESLDGDDPVHLATQAYSEGIQIFTIGIGTTEGEPVPEKDAEGHTTGMKKDSTGITVISHLNETTLKDISQAAGGRYLLSNSDHLVSDTLYARLHSVAITNKKSAPFSRVEDRYVFCLFLSFLCLAAEFFISERKTAFSLHFLGCLLFIFVMNTPLQAASPVDYYQNASAIKLLHFRKGPKTMDAHKIFSKLLPKAPQNPEIFYNLAYTSHQLQRYDQAETLGVHSVKNLKKSAQFKAWYNLGNTEYQQEHYEKAIESYRQSLSLNPNNLDAKHNLELATYQLLKKKPKPPEHKHTPQENSQKEAARSQAQNTLSSLDQVEKEARLKHRPKIQQKKVDKDW